jgi:hypothetical protein
MSADGSTGFIEIYGNIFVSVSIYDQRGSDADDRKALRALTGRQAARLYAPTAEREAADQSGDVEGPIG